MSLYLNLINEYLFYVTEKDIEKLRKLAEQQKQERAIKIKNRILKQTHDVKLAESLSPITKKLKKLDTINESTQKISDVIKESDSNDKMKALPNNSKFSNSMRQMIGSLMNSRNSLNITQDESGKANILGVPIQISEDDTIKTNENVYESTPEIYKALTYTTYTGNTMKDKNDILMMYSIIRDLGYNGEGDRDSKQKTFFLKKLPKLVEDIQNKTFDEITHDSDSDLQGRGVKIIIPSNIIDIYTRLAILLGLKLSGHSDTFTEASNLIDELYQRGEIQNKQQYRNALNKFQTI